MKGLTKVAAAPTDLGLTAPLRHRRRGAALEDAIHAAVFDELTAVGYAGFTIESVAARAQTGKASIYRRWQTKQDLVLDAFCARFGGSDEIVEGMLGDEATTRDLLLQLGLRISELSGQAAEAVRAVAWEVTRDAGLAAAVEEQVHCPKRAALVELLRRGVARGEVRADAACELYADVLPALLTYRVILMNQPVTEQDVVEMVDCLVMPLVAPV